MSRLRDHAWRSKHHSDAGSLVQQFYEPALACAVRYDRTSGYFTAALLTLAARGVENLLNKGHMRLIVGCTLDPEEVQAIERESRHPRGARRQALFADAPAHRPNPGRRAGAPAWMVGQGVLDVKVAVPCGIDRKPVAGTSIFHEKAGIIEDAEADRIAFNGSINETAKAWTAAGPGNWESFHVFSSYDGTVKHVDEEEETFARLWSDKAHHARVIDVPTALREDLLRFLPKDHALPQRLVAEPEAVVPKPSPRPKHRSPRPTSMTCDAACGP